MHVFQRLQPLSSNCGSISRKLLVDSHKCAYGSNVRALSFFLMIAILHVFKFVPLLFSQIEIRNPKGACFDLPPKVVCNQQVYYCH